MQFNIIFQYDQNCDSGYSIPRPGNQLLKSQYWSGDHSLSSTVLRDRTETQLKNERWRTAREKLSCRPKTKLSARPWNQLTA